MYELVNLYRENVDYINQFLVSKALQGFWNVVEPDRFKSKREVLLS